MTHSKPPLPLHSPSSASRSVRAYEARRKSAFRTVEYTLPLPLVNRLKSIAEDTGCSMTALLVGLLDDPPASGPDLLMQVRLANDRYGIQIPVRQEDGSIRRDSRGRKR